MPSRTCEKAHKLSSRVSGSRSHACALARSFSAHMYSLRVEAQQRQTTRVDLTSLQEFPELPGATVPGARPQGDSPAGATAHAAPHPGAGAGAAGAQQQPRRQQDEILGQLDVDEDGSDDDATLPDEDVFLTESVEFTAGNPRVEHITGVVHLYREIPGIHHTGAAAPGGKPPLPGTPGAAATPTAARAPPRGAPSPQPGAAGATPGGGPAALDLPPLPPLPPGSAARQALRLPVRLPIAAPIALRSELRRGARQSLPTRSAAPDPMWWCVRRRSAGACCAAWPSPPT